jgi:hypothetical protein
VISVIIPASLAVLSTLYMGIILVEGCVEMLLSLAHLMSMKHLITLQSTRAWVHHLTTVSIASISTSMLSDITLGLEVTTYLRYHYGIYQ